MSVRALAVVLYGRHVATLVQDHGGAHSLTYTDDPGRTPISLSMPLQQPSHRHRVVEPFLEGLLPDRDDTRDVMGREFGVSGRNPFALLAHVGLDCAGAVQFAPEEDLAGVLARQGHLVPLTDEEIGARLRTLRSGASPSWVASRERWSLAGAQAKVALRRGDDGAWYEARGSEPTTHIVKPGVTEFAVQALNEHVCLVAATRLGLQAATSEYAEFDGEPAIVVTRYDRRRTSAGLTRVHQEDLCQAASVSPRDKYESDGGPSAASVVGLLRRHGRPSEQVRNVERFTSYLVFNYLIGAPDAHAKNYSVLLVDDSARLAPLYDVASGLPYDARTQTGLRSAAMAIGGRREFGRVEAQHWIAFADQTRQEPDALLDVVRRTAAALPDALSDALSSPGVAQPATELRQRLLDRVAQLCASTVGDLDRSSRYRGGSGSAVVPPPGAVVGPRREDEVDRSAAALPPLASVQAEEPDPAYALAGPRSFLSDPPFAKLTPAGDWLVLRALARFPQSSQLQRLPRVITALGERVPSGLLERWRQVLAKRGMVGALRDAVTDEKYSRGRTYVVRQALDTGLGRGPDAVLRVGVFLPDGGDARMRVLLDLWLPRRGPYPLELAVASLADAAEYVCVGLPEWLAEILPGFDRTRPVVEVYVEGVKHDPAYGAGQAALGDLLDLSSLGAPPVQPVTQFAGAASVNPLSLRGAVAQILDDAVWDHGFLGAPETAFADIVRRTVM